MMIAICLLVGLAAYLWYANRRNYQTACGLQAYIQALEKGVDELHAAARTADYVLRWQDDRINNLRQANGQLAYLLDPNAVKPISREYDA